MKHRWKSASILLLAATIELLAIGLLVPLQGANRPVYELATPIGIIVAGFFGGLVSAASLTTTIAAGFALGLLTALACLLLHQLGVSGDKQTITLRLFTASAFTTATATACWAWTRYAKRAEKHTKQESRGTDVSTR